MYFTKYIIENPPEDLKNDYSGTESLWQLVKELQLPETTTKPPQLYLTKESPKLILNTYNNNISFKELALQENLPIKITSEFRPGSRTKLGRLSNHSKKDSRGNSLALDVQPFFNGKVDKSDLGFDKLLLIMYSNPRVVSWLLHNKRGILEETDSHTLSKTGGSGKHLHIGPDTWAKKMTSLRLSSLYNVNLNGYV